MGRKIAGGLLVAWGVGVLGYRLVGPPPVATNAAYDFGRLIGLVLALGFVVGGLRLLLGPTPAPAAAAPEARRRPLGLVLAVALLAVSVALLAASAWRNRPAADEVPVPAAPSPRPTPRAPVTATERLDAAAAVAEAAGDVQRAAVLRCAAERDEPTPLRAESARRAFDRSWRFRLVEGRAAGTLAWEQRGLAVLSAGKLFTWDPGRGKDEPRAVPVDDDLRAVAWSPDGNELAVTGASGTWDLAPMNPPRCVGPGGTAVAFGPRAGTLCVAQGNRIVVFSLAEDRAPWSFEVGSAAITTLLGASGRLFVGDARGVVRVGEVASSPSGGWHRTHERRLEPEGAVLSLGYDGFCRKAVAVTERGAFHFGVDDGSDLAPLDAPGAVAGASDGAHEWALLSRDGTLRVGSEATLRARLDPPPGSTVTAGPGTTQAVAWSPRRDRIAVASGGSLGFWECHPGVVDDSRRYELAVERTGLEVRDGTVVWRRR